jgi:hypothetical protein
MARQAQEPREDGGVAAQLSVGRGRSWILIIQEFFAFRRASAYLTP